MMIDIIGMKKKQSDQSDVLVQYTKKKYRIRIYENNFLSIFLSFSSSPSHLFMAPFY
jgi:hypothetical protein